MSDLNDWIAGDDAWQLKRRNGLSNTVVFSNRADCEEVLEILTEHARLTRERDMLLQLLSKVNACRIEDNYAWRVSELTKLVPEIRAGIAAVEGK